MMYKVMVSELRHGEVEVDAENEEQAKTIASGKEINWFDSKVAGMVVEPQEDRHVMWRLFNMRFAEGSEEQRELYQLLNSLHLSRRQLALIAAGLEIREGFELSDFTDYSDNRTREVTEVCPHCEQEVTMTWDVDWDGFKAFCPYCGKRLMLCDECLHSEHGGNCDYDRRTDSCKFNPLVKQKEPALLTFVREEVRFRLQEMLGVREHDITPELVEDLSDLLYDNADVMFNYDRLDEFLAELLDNRGVRHKQ